MPERWRTFTALMATAGLRIGEAAALHKTDLVVTKNRVGVRRTVSRGRIGPPKSANGVRPVPVPDWLMDALVEQRQSSPEDCKWLFPSFVGGNRPAGPDNYRTRIFKPACEEIGLTGVTPHTLRHTYAARLIARKDEHGNADSVNPQLLCGLMGHATVGFTLDTYGGLYPQDISGGILNANDPIPL
jgi:integrase